jgi:hypothetical protein
LRKKFGTRTKIGEGGQFYAERILLENKTTNYILETSLIPLYRKSLENGLSFSKGCGKGGFPPIG